jgi:hypothetical protein
MQMMQNALNIARACIRWQHRFRNIGVNLTTHESNNQRSLNYLWSNSRRQYYNPFDRGGALENWKEFLLVRTQPASPLLACGTS